MLIVLIGLIDDNLYTSIALIEKGKWSLIGREITYLILRSLIAKDISVQN